MKCYHMVLKGESKVDFHFYLKNGQLHIFGSQSIGTLDKAVQARI